MARFAAYSQALNTADYKELANDLKNVDCISSESNLNERCYFFYDMHRVHVNMGFCRNNSICIERINVGMIAVSIRKTDWVALKRLDCFDILILWHLVIHVEDVLKIT